MKKPLSILALCILPTLAWAAGNHAGGHDTAAHGMQGHDMAAMSGTASPTGQPGDPAKATRTIELIMHDTMRFTPDQIQAHAGETIRFVVKNVGHIPHEIVIGSIAELKAHSAEMKKMPGMQHAEPNMITLAPGKTGHLVWKFGQAGLVDFACLIPGHMEVGMIGKIIVS